MSKFQVFLNILLFIPRIICLSNIQLQPFILAAKLSAIAYCPLNMISSWTCHYCRENPSIESVVSFNDSSIGVQGFVAVLNDAIFVSFRGTANYENQKNIMKFFTTKAFPDLQLIKSPVTHTGFSSSYEAVKPIVQELILHYAIKYPLYNIHFTGHSLGGAIATFAALDAVVPNGYLSYLRQASQIYLFTMGSPRIGNKLFAQAMTELGINVYRSVNYSDPIPHLPLLSVGYYHFPREVYISNERTVRFCNRTEGEDSECSNRIYSFPQLTGTNLKYHGFYYGARMGVERCVN